MCCVGKSNVFMTFEMSLIKVRSLKNELVYLQRKKRMGQMNACRFRMEFKQLLG